MEKALGDKLKLYTRAESSLA